MVLINDNWERVETLYDISNIIRENFNAELADKLDSLIPEHDDIEHEALEWELNHKEDEICDLENEIDDLENKIDRLQDENDRLAIIEGRVDKAIDLAWEYDSIDGNHDESCIIDQIVKTLIGDIEEYKKWIDELKYTSYKEFGNSNSDTSEQYSSSAFETQIKNMKSAK